MEPREGELYGDVLVRDARGVEHREESRNLTPQDRRLRHRDTAILAQLEVADDVPECRVGEVSVRTAFVLREHGPHDRAHLGQRHPDAPSSAALGRCRRVTGPGMILSEVGARVNSVPPLGTLGDAADAIRAPLEPRAGIGKG